MNPNAWFTVPMPGDGLAVLCPGSPAGWDAWLTSQHADSPGLCCRCLAKARKYTPEHRLGPELRDLG